MSEFAFLAVFISIVIGLGVTHLLHGLARIIHNRGRVRVEPLHLVWTANALLILLVNWWVFFLWRDFTAWSFGVFLLLIFWGVTLYMFAVVLYPPDIRGDESYVDLLERNRRWLFGVFILFLLLDLAQTAARGALLRPPIYVPFILHYVALSGVASPSATGATRPSTPGTRSSRCSPGRWWCAGCSGREASAALVEESTASRERWWLRSGRRGAASACW